MVSEGTGSLPNRGHLLHRKSLHHLQIESGGIVAQLLVVVMNAQKEALQRRSRSKNDESKTSFKELIAASRTKRGAKTERRTLAEVEHSFLPREAREDQRPPHRRPKYHNIFAKTAEFNQRLELKDALQRFQKIRPNTLCEQSSVSDQEKIAWKDVLTRWKHLRHGYSKQIQQQNKIRHQTLQNEWSEWLKLHNPVLSAQWTAIRDRRMDLLQWFRVLDLDGSGEISTAELVDPLLTVGLCRNRREVEELVASIDADGSGAIGFDEFLHIICSEDGEGPNSGNALVQLYKTAAQGELGDSSTLDFSLILASYRRKVILHALAPTSEHAEQSDSRKRDTLCVNALANEFWQRKYSIPPP